MYEYIHHVALLVRDIERAKHFYGVQLGFAKASDRPAFDFEGAWYDIGPTQIHLIVPKAGHEAELPRTGHFAVRVTDIDALLARLLEQGVAFENYPDSITPWHQVFVTDPDGNRIEFNAVR